MGAVTKSIRPEKPTAVILANARIQPFHVPFRPLAAARRNVKNERSDAPSVAATKISQAARLLDPDVRQGDEVGR